MQQTMFSLKPATNMFLWFLFIIWVLKKHEKSNSQMTIFLAWMLKHIQYAIYLKIKYGSGQAIYLRAAAAYTPVNNEEKIRNNW